MSSNDAAVSLLLKFSQKAKQLSETAPPAEQQPETATPSPQDYSISLLPSFFELLASLSQTYLGTLQAATNEQRLSRLGDFLEHELCAPAKRNWLEGWQVETDSATTTWKFVTNEGIPLANFTEVAQFFNRSTFAVKLAELVDYLEFERKLPIQLKDWTCSPNLKKTKTHHPSVYSYQPPTSEAKVKQFYQLNLIGDFVEKTILTQFHRARGNVIHTPVTSSSAAAAAAYFEGESEDFDDAEGGSDSESSIGVPSAATMNSKKRPNPTAAVTMSASAAAQMPNPVLRQKWMKRLKPGDAVLVQAKNNAVFHAIICPIPQGERTYDPVEKDVCFSVYYTTDAKHEHGVVARRIQGTRKETKEDMRLKQGALKGLLDADIAAQLQQQQQQTVFGAVNYRKPIPLSSTTAPPAELAAVAKRTQSEEVSKQFLDNVKARIGKTLPMHFHNLVNMVKEVSKGAVSMLELRDYVLDLFGEDDADLAVQFSNGFLPPDLRITARMLRNRHVDQAKLFQLQQQEYKRMRSCV